MRPPPTHLHGPDGLPGALHTVHRLIAELLRQQELVEDGEGAAAVTDGFQAHGCAGSRAGASCPPPPATPALAQTLSGESQE